MPLSEVALLFRSNAQSRVLEHALFGASLPYRVYGGTRFFERAEVKNALAYLRLVAVPGDDGAFLRAVNFPPRGIGARTLEQLQDAAKRSGATLWDAAATGAIGGRSGTSLRTFVALVERLRAETRSLPLPEAVAHIVEISGLAAHYKAEKDGQDRVENLEELVNAAQAYVREAELATDAPMLSDRLPAFAEPAASPAGSLALGPAEAQQGNESPSGQSPSGNAASDALDSVAVDANEGATDPLTAFLAHAALEAGDTQEAEGRPALQLMTVHAAKGLEFHTVFVTGLEEGLFPHEQSLNVDDGIDEERRLMYVALTNAKRKLYLTFAQSRMLHGQSRYNIQSRFLDEIPPEMLQWLSPQRLRARALDPAGWSSAAQPAHASGHSTPQSTPPPLWRIGQGVRHAKFGVGVIIDSEGRGSDARVQVNFRDAGVKWLALEYAKLEAA